MLIPAEARPGRFQEAGLGEQPDGDTPPPPLPLSHLLLGPLGQIHLSPWPERGWRWCCPPKVPMHNCTSSHTGALAICH